MRRHCLLLSAYSNIESGVGWQVAICQCHQLWSLHLGVEPVKMLPLGRRKKDRPDYSLHVREIMSALPNLAAFQWRVSAFGREPRPPRIPTGHTFSAFMPARAGVCKTEAAEGLAGSGLRLLHTEECCFSNVPPLRAELEALSLRSAPLPASLQVASFRSA